MLGSLSGAVYEVVNEPDGEAIAALVGFTSTLLGDAGTTMGLGELRRFHISGPEASRLVTIVQSKALSLSLVPNKSAAAVAKRLDADLRR